MLERTEPPTDPEGELDGRRKKKTQKTEKPCEVLGTEKEELDGSSPGEKPLNNLKE